MERHAKNLAHLDLIAGALKELSEEVTFVGGCTTILLVDEAAFGGVRQTEDVDVIVDVATHQEYQQFSKKLRKLGFTEDQSGPICRWKNKIDETEVKLDVMPDSEDILGFSNRWYSDARITAERHVLPSGKEISVVNAGYFLATKFEAFKGRGRGDFAASHDIEDIVFVLENRKDIVKELIDYPNEVKSYLSEQATGLLVDGFLNVLPGLVTASGGERAVRGYLELIGKW